MKKLLTAWLLLLLSIMLLTSAHAANPVMANGSPITGMWKDGSGNMLCLKENGEGVLYAALTLYDVSWEWDGLMVQLSNDEVQIGVTPSRGKLTLSIKNRTITMKRQGDYVPNAGQWYPATEGGSLSLELRADGTYVESTNGRKT